MNISPKQEQLVTAVSEIARNISGLLPPDKKLRQMFQNCFVSTAKTTTKFLPDGHSYIFTGDIPAMWLRDSSAQVVHYLPFLREYPLLREMVRGLLARQFFYILKDPYGNAFNEEPNGNCWEKDLTDSTPWNWERKYEVDSLCYPVWLMKGYVDACGQKDIFTPQAKQALLTIMTIWETEQYHSEQSAYSFIRKNCPPSDTLSHGGKGTPVGYTGMTWSGFRPSDDACTYGYLLPANMFASVVLGYMADFFEKIYHDPVSASRAHRLKADILSGIGAFGVVNHQTYGPIYAYETDGLGHHLLMDDANVPSLLSLPWLGFCSKDDPLYQNTRAWVLNSENPYYFRGRCYQGIGSPHTPKDYIWHIGLSMQGLTSSHQEEQMALLKVLLDTDAGSGVMHESFHKDHPEQFTRSWFAWADSLFALFVMDVWL